MRYAVALSALLLLAVVFAAGGAGAQRSGSEFATIGDTREALTLALSQQRLAQRRAEQLEAAAASATEQVEQTRTEAAALASRLQETEAALAAAGARVAIADLQYGAIRGRIAERQRPLIGLTATLQNFTRRPVAIAVLRPGSLRDTVYTRAILASALPELRRRTEGLRSELEEAAELRQRAVAARSSLARLESQLEDRQRELAVLESRQQLAQRQASGAAGREAERALALAEQVRDLDTLIGELGRAGSLRAELAALPGPLLRPARPAQAVVARPAPTQPASSAARPPGDYRLPVTGRVLSGFGSREGSGTSRGVALGPPPGAVVVAPAAGRVAFAGPYRGYGRIVIIEHPGRWTSVVTGLARSDVRVGEEVMGGTALGVAPRSNPRVTLELRRESEPVNPLLFLG